MSLKHLWFLVLLALPLGCQPPADAPPADSGDSNSTAAADSPATTTQMVFEIEGMHCNVACPHAVERAFESVPGVAAVTVDFQQKEATVNVDSHQFDQTAAIAALSAAGFQGSLKM